MRANFPVADGQILSDPRALYAEPEEDAHHHGLEP
jgi:hypothetical protein